MGHSVQARMLHFLDTAQRQHNMSSLHEKLQLGLQRQGAPGHGPMKERVDFNKDGLHMQKPVVSRERYTDVGSQPGGAAGLPCNADRSSGGNGQYRPSRHRCKVQS